MDAKRGFEGVTALLSRSKAPDTVGGCLGLSITERKCADLIFCGTCLSMTGDLESKVEGCIQGFLASVDDGSAQRDSIDYCQGHGQSPDRPIVPVCSVQAGHMALARPI